MAHASSYSGAQRTAVAHAPRQELRCLQWNRFSQVATQAAAVTEATRSGKPRNPAAGKDRLARWEDAIAANQRELLHRTMRNTQRLQSRLLDLDLDTDADTTDLSAALNEDAERANSGSSASTSHSYPARRRAVSAPVVPPSPEVLMALLRQTQAKRSRLEELDVRSPRAVSTRLLLLSRTLDLPPEEVLRMAAACGRMLLQPPHKLRAALDALTECVTALMVGQGGQQQQQQLVAGGAAGPAGPASRGPVGPPERGLQARSGGASRRGERQQQRRDEVEEDDGEEEGAESAAEFARAMAARAPQLLLLPPERLRRGGMELAAVSKARGIKALPMLRLRPDLLLQSASSLAAKMDVLPAALGLPHRRVRDVLQTCPDLLRRSPHELARRFRLLQELFGVPPAFLAELVAQEPRVLSFGAATLRAKFQFLAGRYGRFQDDVADTILVDPSVLINAGVEPPHPAPAPAAPRQPAALSSRDDAASRRASTAASLPSAMSSSSSTSSLSSTSSPPSEAASSLAANPHGAQQPVLERLATVAEAAGVPLGPLLEITALGGRVGSSSSAGGLGNGLLPRRRGQELLEAEELRARVDALCGVLRLPGAEAAGQVLRRHPRLLGLGAEELRERAVGLERLVRGEAEGQQQAGGGEAEGEVDVGAMARGRPELLLQDLPTLSARLASLHSLLGGPSALSRTRLGALVAAQPSLLLPPARLQSQISTSKPLGSGIGAGLEWGLEDGEEEVAAADDTVEVADKLIVMQSLFEIPRALVVELVVKEPGLLAVSVDDLERKFRALAASFGAFSSDAIDVVLADPSLILRAGEQQQEQQQQQQGQGQQQQAAGGVEARAARGAGRGEAEGRRREAEGQGGRRKERQQGRAEGRQREERGRGGDGDAVGGQRGDGRGGAGVGGYPADLNTMSAADFDKLGSEGLPAPPPPSRRRRR